MALLYFTIRPTELEVVFHSLDRFRIYDWLQGTSKTIVKGTGPLFLIFQYILIDLFWELYDEMNLLRVRYRLHFVQPLKLVYRCIYIHLFVTIVDGLGRDLEKDRLWSPFFSCLTMRGLLLLASFG